MSNLYQFTLILDGVNAQTQHLEDALFESGCDDSLIRYQHNTIYLDFDRVGVSLEQVILSAIKNVDAANIGARVIDVSISPATVSSRMVDSLPLIPIPVIQPSDGIGSWSTTQSVSFNRRSQTNLDYTALHQGYACSVMLSKVC